MTQEKKYYVPEPSELHIGFELRRHGKDVMIENEDHLHALLCELRGANAITVPFLYGEDIVGLLKELGIEKFADITPPNIQGFKSLVWHNGRYWVHLSGTWLSQYAVIKIETSVEQLSEKTLVVHSIRIKNKNVLKQVMQMLGIV